MYNRNNIIWWIETLTEKQLKDCLYQTVGELLLTESLCWDKEANEPYWETCGDRLTDMEGI